jgi:DNA-directed RNA polymerase subunit K/omega
MKKIFNLLKESQHMDYRRLNIGEEDLDDTKMTNEEKRAFVEAVASYRKIGEAIYHNGNLMEAYQNIKKIVETAHKLTLQETGDWFDKVTVSRHMKSMNESFKIFTNTIKEVSTLQQRLESSYDEIGEILGKYYEIKEGNEFGAERARAIAAGEDTFQVGDKTFKVTDVDSEDKENAKDFVGENMKLSQLINKKSINEGKYDATLDKIEAAVKNASSFMNIGAELKKAGIKYDFSTEMIAMYSIKVPGNTIAIVNKKYAAGAEREVGNYAIGLMEGKNLVKEVKKPKFGDTVHLKSQNKTGMVYSVKGNEVVIKTVSGLVKGKLSDAEIVMDEGNEFGAERARAIAAGEDTFTVGGKTYKVTDVDPQDKENAKDFVGEMKLSNLILKKK